MSETGENKSNLFTQRLGSDVSKYGDGIRIPLLSK
jgi:hypothetical protein